MKEQIIQIAMTQETEDRYGDILALTNKGRLFASATDVINDGEWTEIKLPEFDSCEGES